MAESRYQFRARDKKEKKMLQVVSFAEWEAMLELGKQDEYVTYDTVFNNEERYVVMQWVGLYDKSGVKIFEGVVVRSNGEKSVVEMKWSKTSDSFPYYGYDLWKSENDIEIIGNKWEHPHLLED